MNEILKALLISFLPSLIVAVITAKLTVDLSIKRFRSEKWWEKKHETYERVIGCLARLLYCYREYEKFSEESSPEMISDERRDVLSVKFGSALEEFNEIVSASVFNISDKAAKELNRLREEIDEESGPMSRFVDAGFKRELIENCIRDIKIYSKEDLDIKGF